MSPKTVVIAVVAIAIIASIITPYRPPLAAYEWDYIKNHGGNPTVYELYPAGGCFKLDTKVPSTFTTRMFERVFGKSYWDRPDLHLPDEGNTLCPTWIEPVQNLEWLYNSITYVHARLVYYVPQGYVCSNLLRFTAAEESAQYQMALYEYQRATDPRFDFLSGVSNQLIWGTDDPKLVQEKIQQRLGTIYAGSYIDITCASTRGPESHQESIYQFWPNMMSGITEQRTIMIDQVDFVDGGS